MRYPRHLSGLVLSLFLLILSAGQSYAHTNSVGFDLVDNGDGSCDLEWYYGSWHSDVGIGPEGSFSLYTLAPNGDPDNPADYTLEAYGTGGAVRDETNYFTWPGKSTPVITLDAAIENNGPSFYREDGVGGTLNDIEDTGFVPGTNYFFTASGGSTLTDISGQNSEVYSHQSVTVRNVQTGTYRGFYEGEGSNTWDNTPPPSGTPPITANFEPVAAIQNGLVTVAGGCRVFFGSVPKILIASVEDDNGLSSNDFIVSVRNIVIHGTIDSANVDTQTFSVDVGSDTYTLQDSALVLSGDDWTLTLPSTVEPGDYPVSATVSDTDSETYTDNITLKVVAVSVERISEDDGLSETDLRTSDTSLVIEGLFSESASASLTVTFDNTVYTLNGSAPQDALLSNTGDDWALDVTGTDLAPGNYPVQASVQEGSETYTANRTIEVVEAPAEPTIDAISEDTGVDGDFVTTDQSLIVTGTFDAVRTSTFTIELAGEIYQTSGSNLSVDGSNWTLDITGRALGSGSFAVVATSVDAQGWPSKATRTITIEPDSDGDGVSDEEDPFPGAKTREESSGEPTVALETTPESAASSCSIDSSKFDPDAPHALPEVYIPLGRAVSFELAGCAVGETIQVSVDFGMPLPAGAKVHKVTDEGWSDPIDATISGSVVTYSLTDGGELDEDGQANGVIVDPVSVSLPAEPVPLLPVWALGMLTLILGTAVYNRPRRGRSAA